MTAPGTSPLVSLCIPCFNGETFLDETLASASRQDYPNLEILVVDDGSSDGSREICSTWALRDSRIRLEINHHNLGLVGNWNHAIELAQGEWIKVLFQDDLLRPDCIAQMMARAQEGHPFVVCDRDFIFEAGTQETARHYLERSRASARACWSRKSWIPPDEFIRTVLPSIEFNCVGEPSCALFHRDLIKELGGFDPRLAQICDHEFWLRAGIAHGIAFIDSPLATFRVHAGATTTRNSQTHGFRCKILDPMILMASRDNEPTHRRTRELIKQIGLEKELVRQRHAYLHRAHEFWIAQTRKGGNLPAYLDFLRSHPDWSAKPMAHFLWRLNRDFHYYRSRIASLARPPIDRNASKPS